MRGSFGSTPWSWPKRELTKVGSKNSPPAAQATFQRLRAQLTLKVITVLATLGLLMYLRPALGVGVAIAYAGMLPAVLAVAGFGIVQQRRHGSS